MVSEKHSAPSVVDFDALTSGSGSPQFEGRQHGVAVSFIAVAGQPGEGPRLHKHPYPEVFVVIDGTVRFTVGDDEIVAESEQVVIGPAHVPHRFQIEGERTAHLVNIHPSAAFQTDWIDDA